MRPLHETIRPLRKSKKLTYAVIQRELAKRGIDVGLGTIGHWFTGRRRPDTVEALRALCDVLGVSVAQVIEDDPDFAHDGIERTWLRALRELSQTERESLLAMAALLKQKRR